MFTLWYRNKTNSFTYHESQLVYDSSFPSLFTETRINYFCSICTFLPNIFQWQKQNHANKSDFHLVNEKINITSQQPGFHSWTTHWYILYYREFVFFHRIAFVDMFTIYWADIFTAIIKEGMKIIGSVMK